jgi:putative addiction module antidote
MNAPIKHTKTLKLIKVGNSVGVILPKQVLDKLGVELGDQLDLIEGVEGLQLQRHDEGFAAQMEVARGVMKRRRNALRELAK